MQGFILRQHLLLTEKYQDCERSWRELGVNSAPSEINMGRLNFLNPRTPITDAGYWYLFAKRQDFSQSPGLKLSLSYPISVTLLCLVIFLLVSTHVMPVFSDIFYENGSILPQFSLVIMDNSNAVTTFLSILLATLILLHLFINSSIKQSVILPAWLKIFTIFNQWIDLHNRDVICKRLKAWNLAGIDITAASCKGVIDEEEFYLAKKNANLMETLNKVSPNIGPYSSMQLNQHLNAVLTVILGVVIGALIIALYLPIFQMGSMFQMGSH